MNIKALSFIGICILEMLEFLPCEFSLICQLKPLSEQFSSGQVVQDQSVAFKEREAGPTARVLLSAFARWRL